MGVTDGPIRVLHVDDEPEFLRIAATIIEDEDDRIDVVTATDVEEGLRRLESGQYECVVSDYQMPDRDGIEFLETVRERYPELPFLLFTGKGSEEIASEAISAGVTEYLQKGGGTDQYTVLAHRIRNAVDHARSRERVERSEQRLREIIDYLPHILYVVDEDGEYLLANETLAEFHDTTVEAIEGSTVADVLGETAWERFAANAAEVLESGRPKRVPEVTLTDASGAEHVLQPRLLPYDLAATDSRAVLGIAVDITERKRQERERERIIDRVTDAIVEVDSEWRFTLVNDAAEQLYDMEESDLLGRSFWDVFSAAEGTRFEAAYREVMETREPASLVGYYDGLDGWFDIQVYPEEGGGVAFYFREVTERVERERELERAENRYETLAENFPNGAVHYFDDDLRYRMVSGSGFEPIETSAEDLEGRTIYEVEPYTEEIVGTLEPVMESTLDGNRETIEMEYEDRIYRLRSVPVRDDDGSVSSGFFITQDITEQSRQQEELERKNERLEEFANVISHDLRNPLNVASGRIQLAREDCDSSDLDAAAAAVDRSLAMIDDLLTLAREGNRVDEMEAVELRGTVDRCWQNVETDEASLDVRAEGTVQADRNRVMQLLENLMRNAVEHGGEDVTVRIGELDDGFYVADDGPGVPEGKREDVFSAGYSTMTDGTGFGLNIVAEIVEAHGWEIELDDSRDGGARFEITGVDPG